MCSIFSGEGYGNPLQCSCLENPRDGGAWWAAVYGVAQSRTRLKRLSSSSSSSTLISSHSTLGSQGSFTQPAFPDLKAVSLSWRFLCPFCLQCLCLANSYFCRFTEALLSLSDTLREVTNSLYSLNTLNRF